LNSLDIDISLSSYNTTKGTSNTHLFLSSNSCIFGDLLEGILCELAVVKFRVRVLDTVFKILGAEFLKAFVLIAVVNEEMGRGVESADLNMF
jgi:hypothetical protein